MRVVGLITEYNPFHNGHLHHLRESKRLADAEVAVAVMSGHFVQRGEPALVDKWCRTECALAAGVDLIVEIPPFYACNSAPLFARGAVAALGALGGVDALCFGSESGELAPLKKCAELLESHAPEIEAETRKRLRNGVSYPLARAEIVAALAGDSALREALATPNNILGIEYLRSLSQLGSSIQPLTLPRKGADYHALQVQGTIASATAIRQRLVQGEEVDDLLPAGVAQVLRRNLLHGFAQRDVIFLRLLLARILRGAQSLTALYQVENGLENRLFDYATQVTSLEGLIEGLKSRQLTRTRVQRILCSVYNEITQEFAGRQLAAGPLYLHLLGASRRGEKYLAASRKERRLPLVGNFSRIHNQLQRFYGRGSRKLKLAKEQLNFELRCSDNYCLLHGLNQHRQRDYYEVVRRAPPGEGTA